MIELTALTHQEIDAIHQATLQVLSETGIVLSHPVGIEILSSAGAIQDENRFLIPIEVVEAAIESCASQVKIVGRTGKEIVLGDGTLHWHNLGGARDIYDPPTGQRRAANVQDICDSTRLLDALGGVTTITPFFTPQDVPGELMALAMYRYSLPNTTKPLHGPGVQNSAEVKYIVRMAEVIGPPDRMLSLSASPVSPLTFPDDIVAAIIEIARSGVMFSPLPCPTAGTTAPLSIAGALVQQNAEVLAGLVLAQLVQPGLVITYSGRLAMMEPRSGISVWGGVELGLASAATVQIGHRYGLPVNVYGFSTNALLLDLQSGFERALNSVIPALAGADELSGVGEMEAGVMGSYAQMVTDNEIAASVRRLHDGFEVNEESLAVEVIARVMRGDHNFLGQAHTRSYLRSGEMLLTYLAERHSWETWDREGRKGMAERAQAEAERILIEHQVAPLDQAKELELDKIMSAAEKQLVR